MHLGPTSCITGTTEQAAYTMDSGKIMDPETYLNHFGRNIVPLVMHMMQQYNLRSLLHFN